MNYHNFIKKCWFIALAEGVNFKGEGQIFKWCY